MRELRAAVLSRLAFAASLMLSLAASWLLVASPPAVQAATGFGSSHFQNTWSYTDQPVSSGQASRTWMWGPAPYSQALVEPYWDSSTGWRLIQYFDKSRMEITHQDGDQSSIWYVTNGLLAKELITGNMQLGDNMFEQYAPAQVNVAGDANDPNGPTYATFNTLMGFNPIPSGWTITQTVDRAGHVGDDQSLSTYHVTAQDIGAPTNHTVASVFWDFMNSSGPVDQNGQTSTGRLFQNPFYATGYPLTEAYWTNVLVGGVQKQVLVQVFERRVLTYTPSNPDGWQVEAGNVGQHYYTWRYQQLQQVTMPMVDISTTTASAHFCAPSKWTTTDQQADQFYSQHVTLVYNETQCRVLHPEDGVWWDQSVGTVAAYAGDSTSGTPIDTRSEYDFFYYHDADVFWGNGARWNRTSTDRLYDSRQIVGGWDHLSNALDGTTTWHWNVYTSPPQSDGGTFADHPQTCTLDSWVAVADTFGMAFHARLEPNTLPGAPTGQIPYVFNVTGVNLDVMDLNHAVTLPAGATLGHFPTGNCLYVYMSPSTPAGQYTVGLTLPDGRHASVSFQHLPTIGGAPAEGSTLYQSPLTDLQVGKESNTTASVADGTFQVHTQDYFGWAAATIPGAGFGDTSASLDVRLDTASASGYACLYVRRQSGDDLSLCLLNSGETTVLRDLRHDNMSFTETVADRAVRAGTNPVTAWNTLTVVSKGNVFWFSINGTPVGAVEYDALPQGSIGVYVTSTGTAPMTWEFKNLTVKSVS